MLGYVLLSIVPLTASVAQGYRKLRALGPLMALAALAIAFAAAARTSSSVEVSEVQLSFEPLSRLAFTAFLMLAALGMVYGWLAGEGERVLMMGLAITGFLGLTFSLSRDLLSAGLAFELAALAGALAIGARAADRDARSATMRYLSYVVTAGMCLVGAFSLATRFEVSRDPTLQRLTFGLLSVFVLVVLGVFPFNLWFPKMARRGDLMAGSLMASALAIGGAWLFLQSYGSLPWLSTDPAAIRALLGVATLGTVGASLMAAASRRLDHLIAYSAASNAGTILVGIVSATSLGLVGGMFSLLNYLWALLLVHMCLDISGRVRSDGNFEANLRRTPSVILGLTIGGLALAGAPPAAGFAGRWMIYEAIAGYSGYLVFFHVVSSALVFLGYARFLKGAWLNPEPRPSLVEKGVEESVRQPASDLWERSPGGEELEDEPTALSAIVILLAVVILVVGVYPTPILEALAGAL
ncbi:MAG: hypothetical protein M1358_06760, partial [Chloroflexi bacterium]|nr:hypothetical protein [Chloroflexota bacterium]